MADIEPALATLVSRHDQTLSILVIWIIFPYTGVAGSENGSLYRLIDSFSKALSHYDYQVMRTLKSLLTRSESFE